jgi:hypothetical protein
MLSHASVQVDSEIDGVGVVEENEVDVRVRCPNNSRVKHNPDVSLLFISLYISLVFTKNT